MQEAKLAERPSYLRRGLQRREVGVVEALLHPFISEKAVVKQSRKLL